MPRPAGPRRRSRRPPRRCRRPPSTWGPRGSSPRARRDGAHSGALAVRRRPLPARVAERGEHERAVARAVHRVGDGPPPGAAVGRQRAPLVGPVGRRGPTPPRRRPRRPRPRRAAGSRRRAGRTPRGRSPRFVSCGPNSSRFGAVRPPRGSGFEQLHVRPAPAPTGLRPRRDGSGAARPAWSGRDRPWAPWHRRRARRGARLRRGPLTHSGSGPSSGRPVKNLAAMQPPWQAS